MRLRIFTAATVPEAMARIRAELGADAIIVSTQRAGTGVRVTAAAEERPAAPSAVNALARLREAILAQGVGEALALRLLDEAGAALSRGRDAATALATALAATVAFDPLSDGPTIRPLMLMGPPGAGKTSLIARLAARAWQARRSVRLVTTDLARAGGIAQLRGYAEALKLELATAGDGAELAALLARGPRSDVVLIDTPGTNPYAPKEFEALARLRVAADLEPVLVLAAGVDTTDGGELAAAFKTLGCRRAVATRLDLARRLGGPIGIAAGQGLALAGWTDSPRIAEGVAPAEALALARRLLGEAASDLQPPLAASA